MDNQDFAIDTNPLETQESAYGDVQAAVEQEEQYPELSEALDEIVEGSDSPDNADEADTKTTDTAGKKGKRVPLSQRFSDVEKRGYDRGREEAAREEKARWDTERQSYEDRIAKLAEYEIQSEATQLAEKEKISKDLALRLIRAERGSGIKRSETQPTQTEPAQPKATYTPTREANAARAQQLMSEAAEIKRNTGLDMLDMFQKNESFRRAVAKGETSFTAAAAAIMATRGGGSGAPSTVRGTATGGGTGKRKIMDMSSAELSKLDEALSRGGRFR